jgi:hypothetical protein
MDKIRIYALDGSTQCGFSAGVAPDEMAAELRDQDIEVFSANKLLAPIQVVAMCGAPTGMANVFEIALAKLPQAMALGRNFQPWLFDAVSVEVYQYDGTVQCQDGPGRPVSESVQRLETAGVKVLGSRKDRIGAVPALCGWPTGAINVAEVSPEQFAQAQALGFALLSAKGAAAAVHVDSDDFRKMVHVQKLGLMANQAGGQLFPDFPREPLPKFPLPPGFPSPLSFPFPFPRPFPLPSPFPTPFPNHAHVLISELPGHVCRVIRPGDMVTLDLRPDRFNITLDANGVVTSTGFF